MRAELALMDHRAPGGEPIFDRILERDHVRCTTLIEEIDQRRERGRLAGARRTAHQHEAVAELHDRRELWWQPELGEAGHAIIDQPRRDRTAVHVIERVDADANTVELER